MDISAWIGPVIIAAVVSFLGGVVTLLLTHRQTIKLEGRRREERIRDVQTALRAEIRSNWLRLGAVKPEEHGKMVIAKMLEGGAEDLSLRHSCHATGLHQCSPRS